jgi:sec-independent protein translocase protein TatB
VFDLSLGKIAIIAVLALFLLGPEKLPQYAAQLGRWVRLARTMTDDAKQRLASEMGPEFEDVDWARLDPRRYDPRRMLQEAWNRPADDEAPRDATPDRTTAPAVGEPGLDLLAVEDDRAREADAMRARAAGPERPFDLT